MWNIECKWIDDLTIRRGAIFQVGVLSRGAPKADWSLSARSPGISIRGSYFRQLKYLHTSDLWLPAAARSFPASVPYVEVLAILYCFEFSFHFVDVLQLEGSLILWLTNNTRNEEGLLALNCWSGVMVINPNKIVKNNRRSSGGFPTSGDIEGSHWFYDVCGWKVDIHLLKGRGPIKINKEYLDVCRVRFVQPSPPSQYRV